MQSLLVSFRYADVSKVHTVSIIKGDETSLYFETTRRYIPEDYLSSSYSPLGETDISHYNVTIYISF
jgi:hypothetical protein